MSVCATPEDDNASEEASGGGGGAPVREMYETRAVSKVVRVLTVLAYLLSVSLAAILLSVYYVCVWKSPELPPLNDTEGEVSAGRGHHQDYHVQDLHTPYSFAGGSNISISEEPPPTPDNVTAAEPPDPPPAGPPRPPDAPLSSPGTTTATDVIGTSTANETDVT